MSEAHCGKEKEWDLWQRKDEIIRIDTAPHSPPAFDLSAAYAFWKRRECC